MTTTLKIDFVSDVSCPWCAIGLRSLQTALDQVAPEVVAERYQRLLALQNDIAWQERERRFEQGEIDIAWICGA